jgi:acetyl esterase/lipase
MMPPELLDLCIRSGISVAAIDYRLSGQALALAAMLDGAGAIQFLRFKAKEWNLNPKAFAAVPLFRAAYALTLKRNRR